MKALRNPWISISLYHNDIEKVIHDVVLPVKDELYDKDLTSKVIFNRSFDRGENAIIMCEINEEKNRDLIKSIIKHKASEFFDNNPAPVKKIELPVNDWFLPFPNNHVHVNDYFLFDIMETGGLQASMLAEELLSESSSTILDFIEVAGEEWNIDTAIGLGIQLHIVLFLAFDKNLDHASLFYESFFNTILNVTQGGDDQATFKKELLDGLQTTFKEQKENLRDYVCYITSTLLDGDEFEDEWLNDWFRLCQSVNNRIKALQTTGEFIAPEAFELNHNIGISEEDQQKWLVIQYYLRSVNSQLGILNAYELNLVYTIKECIALIAEEANT
jgi:hypothetical protein